MELTTGQTLGDYEVLNVLGTGGMGKVYQVRNLISQRVEAMKVLLPDLSADPELAERFLNEIRISASLDHPNIAALRTAQRAGNQLLMIMEFVEGSTLDKIMRNERLPSVTSLDYTAQALGALSYAHSRGVVHRDIKPGNIMLMPNGTVKLMDFGIAKVASDKKLTKTGVMVGSVYYMSPEQIEGRELDGRSDLYSLGVTLYEMVTGKRPFNGDSEYQIMAAHLKENPPPPRDLDSSLPLALNEIVLMALAKDPAKRFQSADAFRQALSSVMNTVPQRQSPPQASKTRKERRLLYMVAGSVATIAVIGAALIELPKYRSAGAHTVQTEAVPVQPVPAQPAPAQPISAQPVPADTPVIHADPRSHQIAARVEPTQTPLPEQTQTQPTPPPVAVQPAAIAPPQNTAELSDLRDRLMQLGARTSSIEASLNRLQQEQAKQGLGLRGDMVAAQQRLSYQLGEADANLKQSDAAGAKKHLDSAERDLETIEKFLGR